MTAKARRSRLPSRQSWRKASSIQISVMGDFVDLFFPLAFFFLALSLGGVVVAFFVLDDEMWLIRWVQRVFGSWLAAFSLVLVGALALQVWVVATAEVGGALPTGELLHSLFLAGWTVAFGTLSLAGAYFLLALWSTAVYVEAAGITRRPAFGRDAILGVTIVRIVEIVYFYRITGDIREFRTRSFFIVISRCGPLGRYALYRPTSTPDEDEFRACAEKIAPLLLVPLPGLPTGRFKSGQKDRRFP
jgi:hypothetical protein